MGSPITLNFKQCFLTKEECLTFVNRDKVAGDALDPIYYNKKSKICWEGYQSDYYYIKLKSQTTDNMHELVDKCDKYYYAQGSENTCVPECKDIITGTSSLSLYFISGNQKCLSTVECFSYHKYYYDIDNNECLESCKGRSVNKFQKPIPEYGVDDEKVSIECLNECTGTISYYNFDSNICLAKCGIDGSNKKYHKYNDNICYPSCADIPGGIYKNEIEDTINDVYICYDDASLASDTTVNCDYYYLKTDGSKKCTNPAGCKAKNYIYLIVTAGTSEKECKDRCDEYYKYETSIQIGSNDVTFFECYLSENDCPKDTNNKQYYNTNIKKCWKQYQPEYFIKDRTQTSTIELVEECEKYYFKGTGTTTTPGVGDNDKYYCTDKCYIPSDINFYFISGKKNCENDCSIFNRHFYNPTNHECVDTCKDLQNLEFANQIVAPNTQEECRVDCISNSNTKQYYDYGTNICIQQCTDNDNNKKYTKYATDGSQYVCYSSCAEIPGGTFIYEKGNICYDSPPSGDVNCAYFYIKANNDKQCASKPDCVNKKFKYFIEDSSRQHYECRENCDGYYKMEVEESMDIDNNGVNEDVKLTKCYDSKEKALLDTQVKYYNIKSKLCWKEYPNGYYILPFETGTTQFEVVEECEFFYYKESVLNTGSSTTYHNEYHCVEKCTDSVDHYFIKGQKNCENSCTIFEKHFFNPNTNECLDNCKGLTNLEFANKITTATQPEPCKQQCDDPLDTTDTNIFYDFDSNICITKCGLNNENYIYHTNLGNAKDNICYPSCKEIQGNVYKYEIVDPNDSDLKVCLTGKPATGCDYFYKKKDGTLKCLANTQVQECLDIKYNYLLDNECKVECNDYFILEDDYSVTGFLKCYKTKQDCLDTGANHYNTKLKKCWINFPDYYFINTIDTDPDDATYIKYEIVPECSSFYFEDSDNGNHFRCINECADSTTSASGTAPSHPFFVRGQKKCEISCIKFSKNYYDQNNECLDTCLGKEGLEFANKIDFSTDPTATTPCKSECDANQHYIYGTKLCIDSADCAAINKLTFTAETGKVCYNSCAEIPGRNYIYESGNNCYEESDLADTFCKFYYLKEDGSRQCIPSSSSCIANNYEYLFGNECRKNCDDYYVLMDPDLADDLTKECFLTHSDGLNSPKGIIYYEIENKNLWREYPSNYFIKNENNGFFELLSHCEYFYYEKDTINHVNWCTPNCKIYDLFFISGNNECKSSCQDFSKDYYNDDNNECFDTCLVLDNKYSKPINIDPVTNKKIPEKCLNRCEKYFITKTVNDFTIFECIDIFPYTSGSDTYNFIDIKTNELLISCPNSDYYQLNSFCYPKCDVMNGYTYIDSYNYNCLQACPSYLKKQVLIGVFDTKKLFLCQSSCDEEEFRLEDKCLEKCPKEFNHIGHNKICQENCATDPNGQHYYPINEDSISDPEDYIYKCVNSCDEAIVDPGDDYLFFTELNPNKCLRKCPNEIPFYLSSEQYKCLSKCPEEIPFYTVPDPPTYYYQCSDIGCSSGEFFQNGVCVTACSGDDIYINYIGSYPICLNKCPAGKIKQKNLDSVTNTFDGTYTCKSICDYTYKENEVSEPECLVDCPKNWNYIGKNNFCKQSCGEEDGFYYYELKKIIDAVDPSNNYEIYKCIDDCRLNNEGYIYKEDNDGKQCYDECTEEYPYLSAEEFRCYKNCLNSPVNPFTLAKTDNSGLIIEKICLTECTDDNNNQNIYYGENKICISDCTQLAETPLINYNNKCVAKCDFSSHYPFQLRGKCVEECDIDDPASTISPKLIRYSKGDYLCKEKCGENEKIVKDGRECVNTCDGFLDPLNMYEYKCIDSCLDSDNGYNFYYMRNKICVAQCNTGHKAVQDSNMCVNNCNDLTDKQYFLYESGGPTDPNYGYDSCLYQCPDPKPYISANQCIDICPEEKKYFQAEFIHGEENMNKFCKSDCPEEYPYYTEIPYSADPTKFHYACKSQCESFVPNDDELKIAKLCLPSCPSGVYKYQILTELNGFPQKKCYENCPVEKKYHFADSSAEYTTDNNCYEECPEESPYHDRGNTECKKQSEFTVSGYILYDIKEFVPSTSISSCPLEYNLYSKVGSITICLKDQCQYAYDGKNYFYQTPYNTCVDACSTTDSTSLAYDKNLINDVENKKCICENLYYRDETTHQIVCYSGSTGKTCKSMESTYPYPLPLNGTNQCLKMCSEDRILNPSENVCYEKNTPCSSIASHTKLIIKNEQKKCECAFKYYYDNDGVTKKCLGENEICPRTRSFYIPDSMECMAACPNGYYTFKNFCLNHCPAGSEIDETNKKCDCGDKFWRQLSDNNYECIEGAPLDDYALLAPSTNQILKSCKGTYYNYLFENKCYESCSSSYTGVNNLEQRTIDSELTKFICECKRPWYYDPENDNKMYCPDNSINRCEDYNNARKYMIDETKECVSQCPTDYPYYFNNKCYTSCDAANDKYILNIEKINTTYECVCPNLWYIDPEPNNNYNDKHCYPKNINECEPWSDPSERYLINSNKQCVESRNKCPTNSYKFNFICYDQCPEFTIEGTDPEIGDKICTCDLINFLYLDYEKYGNKYYQCGLNSCPNKFVVGEQEYLRKNILENERKCVDSCTNESNDPENRYKYSFRDVCIEQCPNGTVTVEDRCEFYLINDVNNFDTRIKNLSQLKDAANIQAKELYANSNSLSGYLANKFDASLQIYALNKLNDYRHLSMKSNLTYIDLGTCLEKIYEDNSLKDDDKILVTKYDLLTRSHNTNNNNNNEAVVNNEPNTVQNSKDDKFLINQVEYEFYLERTMEKIEGSICSPHEIEISYPIFYNKKKFDNFASGINYNDYLKKFMIGKELHEKNSDIDTFNKDNIVYKDLCLGLEINGKDLVLEERYNFLYPNNVSLCESNCSMKNTDFDLQRINCMCSYKEVFDFNRIDEETNDILNDPNFYKTTQSGANAEIIKCIKEISVKDGIVNNEAFYYCTVVLALELSMAITSTIIGVKTVAGFTKGILGNNTTTSVFNSQKGKEVIHSTNRMLNNPPKKGEEKENKDEDYNRGNIVIKKNIRMNNKPNKEDISGISVGNNTIINNESNNPINYGLNKKEGFPKNKKKINFQEEIENKTNLNSKYNTVNVFSNKKAEFIPPQYNFKFFKPKDKGIVKQINRRNIPFEIDKNTKILLEGKENVLYDDNYLEGPFYEDQNIIEVIDDTNINNNINTNINTNVTNDNKLILKKNIKNNNNLSKLEENINSNRKSPVENSVISEEKGFITIKKINPIMKLQMTVEDIKEEEEVKNIDSTTSIYNLMKREHTYLRATYEKYIYKKHPNILATFLAEILDKIYIIKIFIFLKKFELLSIQLSLYLFYHILLLSLLCGFFTVKNIKKIFEDPNFPTMNFYLLYGFLSNVIIWIIYKAFSLLLDNQDRIRSLVKYSNDISNNNSSRNHLKENNNININDLDNNTELKNNKNPKDIVNEKYEDLIKKIKIQTAVFYIVVILISGFCFIYLVSFFAVYTGTKGKVLKAYYISIIEIILIKFVYGLCLASLRIAGEGNELKSLYNFVYVCDKYLS